MTAFIQVPSSEQRYTVPADAVQLLNGSAVVFRYQRGVVVPVLVVVDQKSANLAEILQGARFKADRLAATSIRHNALQSR